MSFDIINGFFFECPFHKTYEEILHVFIIDRKSIQLKFNCGFKNILSIKEILDKLKLNLNKKELYIFYKEQLSTQTIKDKLKKANEHIEVYFNKLKENIIKEYSQRIKNIEKAYDEAYNDNKNILVLIEYIIVNYNCSYSNLNFYIEENKGNDEPSLIQDNSIVVMNYFKTYSLIRYDFNEYKRIDNSNSVTAILLLKDGRIASSSDDKTIKIFDPNKDYNLDYIIPTNNSMIQYLTQLTNGHLVSCSYDCSIIFWSLLKTNYKMEYTISQAHPNCLINKVICLTKDRIASCSSEEKIKIWKGYEPYSDIPIQVLTGHKHDLRSILQIKDKELLASCSYDNTLRIWNLITYQCITSIDDISCNDANSMLQVHDEKIIIGGEKRIALVNFITGIVEQEIKNDNIENIVSFEQLNNSEVLFGSETGSIGIYNMTINSITNKINIHSSVVSGIIKINESMFISSSWDRNIIIWKYE